MQGASRKTQEARRRSQDTGSRMQDAQSAGRRMQDAGRRTRRAREARHKTHAKRTVHDPQSKIQNPKSETGASLVEILVATAIIASALVIFIAALSTGAFAVRASNQLTTANNLAAAQLESIKAAAYVTGTATYPFIFAPAGYTLSQAISYWNGTLFVSNPAADAGMQWITVTVSYSGGAAAVSNYKVNR